jgi:uncharacterized protein (UPF0276 family)
MRAQASSQSMPAAAGIGLRSPHVGEVLSTQPGVAWLEVHSENYFAAGGAHLSQLETIRERYPLSLHGVGLSLGSTDPLDGPHLERLRRTVNRFEPGLVSEHLAWSSVGGRHANDLLPLPYTEEALRHVSRRIATVQDALGRQLLIENVSSYVEFSASRMREWEFLAGVAAESGCGLLIDVNNIYVSARNLGFDPDLYMAAIPPNAVRELHLAGHTAVQSQGRDLLIDTHGAPVTDAVWNLYGRALTRFGAIPTLIEWDTDLPPLSTLIEEAAKADVFLGAAHAQLA